jgi:hypothetical protein
MTMSSLLKNRRFPRFHADHNRRDRPESIAPLPWIRWY